MGKLEQAFADCNMAMVDGPGDGFAHFCRGNVYWFDGQPDRAIEDYTESIRLFSRQALAYFQRGYVNYMVKKQPEKAIPDFSRYIRLYQK